MRSRSGLQSCYGWSGSDSSTSPGCGMDLLEELRWKWFVKVSGIKPTGVIYVGAHLGENIPGFLLAGFSRILAVEPDPADYAILSEYASRRIACENVALASQTGTATLYQVTGASALNSLRPPD